MKLFTATSYMKAARPEDIERNAAPRMITVGWHVKSRPVKRDAATLISVPDCDAASVLPEMAMRMDYADECFDSDEIQQFRTYLSRAMPLALIKMDVAEVQTPIDDTYMAYGAIEPGCGDEFIQLEKTPGYNLPFVVWGHYYMWENDDQDQDDCCDFCGGDMPS